MHFRRANEKLLLAVVDLVAGVGDARARVARAYIQLRRLGPTDLPADLLDEWKSILTALTKFGPERDSDGKILRGAIENTTKRIRNRTASEIARRIFALYRDVREASRNR